MYCGLLLLKENINQANLRITHRFGISSGIWNQCSHHADYNNISPPYRCNELWNAVLLPVIWAGYRRFSAAACRKIMQTVG